MRYQLTKNGEHISYYPDTHVGWIVDGKKRLVSPPDDGWTGGDYALDLVADADPEPVNIQPRLAGRFSEFMKMFTSQEQTAIASAAMQNVPIKLWYDQAVAENYISLTSNEVAAGIAALVSANLLTQARADEILGGSFDA